MLGRRPPAQLGSPSSSGARKRKANIRRFTVIGFIAILVIGIIALAGGFSNSKSSTTIHHDHH